MPESNAKEVFVMGIKYILILGILAFSVLLFMRVMERPQIVHRGPVFIPRGVPSKLLALLQRENLTPNMLDKKEFHFHLWLISFFNDICIQTDKFDLCLKKIVIALQTRHTLELSKFDQKVQKEKPAGRVDRFYKWCSSQLKRLAR